MSKASRRAAFLSSLGAGLEYYDFVIYGMMASYLGTLFFASDEAWIAVLKAFGVFAVGYLARPVGGVLFGMVGDAYGRKRTFLAVMLLMATATFCIGLLPTYSELGGAAALLLIVLRLLQGLSFGAELPGAITVVCEYSGKQQHGTYSGFVISSVGVGASLASLVLYTISYNLELEQILAWAWRIPFLLGGVLALVNYYIRKHLEETPEFIALQKKRQAVSWQQPLRILLRDYRQQVVVGVGLTWLLACMVIFALYMPTYLTTYFGRSADDVYLAMTYGTLWSSLLLPGVGWVTDRVGPTRMLAFACVLFAVITWPLFRLAGNSGGGSLILFMVLYQTVIALVTVSYFPLLASLFPTEVRYTGIAACYNIAYSMMGSLPFIATALIGLTGRYEIGIALLVGSALITMVSGMAYSKTSRNIRSWA